MTFSPWASLDSCSSTVIIGMKLIVPYLVSCRLFHRLYWLPTCPTEIERTMKLACVILCCLLLAAVEGMWYTSGLKKRVRLGSERWNPPPPKKKKKKERKRNAFFLFKWDDTGQDAHFEGKSSLSSSELCKSKSGRNWSFCLFGGSRPAKPVTLKDVLAAWLPPNRQTEKFLSLSVFVMVVASQSFTKRSFLENMHFILCWKN